MKGIIWRLASPDSDPLDGEEAKSNGGRWSSRGTPVVYTSTTLSLAVLEFLAHLDSNQPPDDLHAFPLRLPRDIRVERVTPSDLPHDWNEVVEHADCVKIGDCWARELRSAVLFVPSALVPEEENVLINPLHPEAARIRVDRSRPFRFDARLVH